MCFYQDEHPEFCSDGLCRAKKEFSCDGCCNRIQKRELYSRQSGKLDGSFYTYRSCGACELDRHRIHIMELADDCAQYESWCQADELDEALEDRSMNRSSREQGQRWLEWILKTGNRGIGTERGWQEFIRDKQTA